MLKKNNKQYRKRSNRSIGEKSVKMNNNQTKTSEFQKDIKEKCKEKL